MKTCSRCGQAKSTDEFYVRRDKPANPCKACVLEINQRWYLEHREAVHRRTADRARAKRLGMTYEEYLAAGDPGSQCAICGAPPEGRRNGLWGNGKGRTGSKRLAIDHSHTSGKLRGFLCGHCNRALGLADDSPELLRKMADYLERGAEMAPFGTYRPSPKTCSVDGCGRQVSIRGLCLMHAARLAKRGTTDDPTPLYGPICTVEGCERQHSSSGYCRMHYKRFKRLGDAVVGWVPPEKAATRCATCGTELRSYRTTQRFCSMKCRNAWHQEQRRTKAAIV